MRGSAEFIAPEVHERRAMREKGAYVFIVEEMGKARWLADGRHVSAHSSFQ
jgi:hypothetical protein